MLFKLSNLNSNLALTLGYLNPALKNSAQNSRVIHLLPRSYLLTHPYISLLAFNFNGQSLKLLYECGPTISDHTKQHCRNKRSMITPEA